MKYLSDLLYVDIDTSGFLVPNIDYQVWMINPTTSGHSRELIYTGRIWKTGGKVRIYLNDIIATHTYDNSYITEHISDTPSGVLFNIKVVIPSIAYEYNIDGDPYIMNYYKDAKTIRYDSMMSLDTGLPYLYNILFQRTNVLPRIPKLGYATDNFFLSSLIATTSEWRYSSEIDGDAVYNIVGTKDDTDITNYMTFDNGALINAITIKGQDLYDLTKESDKIYFTPTSLFEVEGEDEWEYKPELVNCIPIAIVDECPSDYYLIWIDRTGAYQCQPFNGKVTLSESISTNYRYDAIDTEVPFNKKVTDKWNLNSNWLTYEEYKAYESIFTSKYLYLFDTKNDEGWEVVLDTNKWTEKTKENKDKMFNLQLDMHSARPQNILY